MAAASSNNDDDLIAGINVTPLVDITLVLLIIFMVTARMIDSKNLPMELPKAASGVNQVQQQFGVELHQDGTILVDGVTLKNDEAVFPLAKEAYTKNSELRVVIRADQTVQHGRVIKIIDLLKQAGVSRIAFGVSPTPPEPGAAPPKEPVEVK